MPTLTVVPNPTTPGTSATASGVKFAKLDTRLLLDGAVLSAGVFRPSGNSGKFQIGFTVSVVATTQTLVAQQRTSLAAAWTEATRTTIVVQGGTTPLTVSNIVAGNIAQTSAIVSWATNVSAGGQVEYGTTTAYGSFTAYLSLAPTQAQAVSGLAANTLYHYRIRADDERGHTAASADGTFTTLASAPTATVPGVPTGLTATSGLTTVNLAWVAPASNGGSAITGYKVYRGGVVVQTLNVVLTWQNTGLTDGVYSYQVAAVNAVGEGAKSSSAVVTVGPTVVLSLGGNIAAAMAAAVPGTTIYLRAGTYTQSPNLRPASGTASARNTLASYPGEQAVIAGLPVFNDCDYWTFKNIHFTQGTTSGLHLVKWHGGTGWILDGIEVYGATQTGLLVGRSSAYGPPTNYTIKNSTFRDCGYTPAYINPGRDATGGVIEHNLFLRAGTENVKLGWGGTDVAAHLGEFGVGGVTFRYNTCFQGGSGPNLVIAEPSDAKLIDAHHNIFVNPGTNWAVRIDNVEGQLGSNITVHDNLYWDASQFAYDFDASPSVMAAMADNDLVDPQLDATFHPQNGAATSFGRFAP